MRLPAAVFTDSHAYCCQVLAMTVLTSPSMAFEAGQNLAL